MTLLQESEKKRKELIEELKYLSSIISCQLTGFPHRIHPNRLSNIIKKYE